MFFLSGRIHLMTGALNWQDAAETEHPDHRVGGPRQKEVLLLRGVHDDDHPGHHLPGHADPHQTAGAEGQVAVQRHLWRLLQDPALWGRSRPVPRLHGQHVHADLRPGIHHHLWAGQEVRLPVFWGQHCKVAGGRRFGLPGGAEHHCSHRRRLSAADDAGPRAAPHSLPARRRHRDGEAQKGFWTNQEDRGTDFCGWWFSGFLQGLCGFFTHLHPKQCRLVAFLSLLRRLVAVCFALLHLFSFLCFLCICISVVWLISLVQMFQSEFLGLITIKGRSICRLWYWSSTQQLL